MQKVSILMIEDNEGHIELLNRALRATGIHFQVTQCLDGNAAMQYIRSPLPNPDVIFLDLNLPFYNGHEILMAFKAASHTKNIPVVIVSSSDTDLDKDKAKNGGAADYLVKPVRSSILKECLYRLLPDEVEFA